MQVGLCIAPVFGDPSKLQLINCISMQKAIIASDDELIYSEAGWATLKHNNGSTTKLRDLLPAAVCITADGRQYVGYQDGSKLVDQMNLVFQLLVLAWSSMAPTMATRTAYKWPQTVKGQLLFWDVREWQEP